jgi:glutamate-1-semialdehyde 2,1-aminomutase
VVAKVAAGYDGWYDDVALGWTGSAEADLQGDRPVAQGTTLVRWNDLADLEALFAERDDIAAVLVEPMLANAGCLMPEPGYLAALGRMCRRHGAMVIADEVLTGMRLHPGPTASHLGLEPDLAAMGKAIGSGLPVAAVLGTESAFAAVLDGRVPRAGTYHGNPLVAAAVIATCEALGSADYQALLRRGAQLRQSLVEAFGQAGLEVSTSGLDSVFSLWFSAEPPTRYEEAKRLLRPGLSLALHQALRREGVVVMPSPWGRMFLSMAHDDADLQHVSQAFGRAAPSLMAVAASWGG